MRPIERRVQGGHFLVIVGAGRPNGCAMERIEETVFLSYRRTNYYCALAIFQNLTQHGYDVFFDFTSIASGDFERVILENVTSRAHFVVLLTPSALERCSDPGRLVAPRNRDGAG